MQKEESLEQFVERMGLSFQEDGWSRIAGRMFALFVVHGGPLSLAEIAERLCVSHASASTNARTLRDLGVLEREARPGDRQDYYRLADDPYGRLLDGYVNRMQRKRETIAKLEAATPVRAVERRRRLAEWRGFYEAAIETTRGLGERVRAGKG